MVWEQGVGKGSEERRWTGACSKIVIPQLTGGFLQQCKVYLVGLMFNLLWERNFMFT